MFCNFQADLERKWNVFSDFQQKSQQMLKVLYISEFWSKCEIFHFSLKFGVEPLIALGKQLYKTFCRVSESIVSKLYCACVAP